MNPRGRYFEVWPNMHIPGRWHVKGPRDEQGQQIIPWRLQQGMVFHTEMPLVLLLGQQGHALDFSLTGLNIPVVNGRFVSVCERLGIQHEVQFIPARVEEHPEPYFVLNPLRIIKCIDESRCEEVTFWEPRHGVPEKVGHYRNVVGMKVEPEKIGDANIFRPWGWQGALIVSERFKRAMEEEGLSGPSFVEV
jgi:hypothetical protein